MFACCAPFLLFINCTIYDFANKLNNRRDYVKKDDRDLKFFFFFGYTRDLKFHERKDAIYNRCRIPTSSLRLLTKGTNK